MYRHAAGSPGRAVSARGLVVATKWAGNRGPIAARGGRRAGLGTGAIQGQHPPTLANTITQAYACITLITPQVDLRLKVTIGNRTEDISR